MRRVLLFAAFLVLLGLSTAVAASFEVQAEDITSFTTDVSISVPPTDLPDVLYIRGDADLPPGAIDLVPPEKNDSVTGALILLDAAGVTEQTDRTRYFTWQTPAAPYGGYLLHGTVTLLIEQDGGKVNRMTAGLFECDAAAEDHSTQSTCELITATTGDTGSAGGNGFEERVVQFGSIGPHTIDEGRQLRLKIVNQAPASASDWRLQWGYLPARQSRLVITAP